MKIDKQILNFIKVGIINTIFYYTIYSSLIYINFNYKVSVLVATIIGVLFSFKTFGKYVFDSDDKTLVFKFILIYVFLYIVNIIIITYLNHYDINFYISGFVATLLCAILSFVLNKYYVFKKK